MKLFKILLLFIISVTFLFCKPPNQAVEIIPAENFKIAINNKAVALFTLKNSNGMTVQITNYGARVVALWVPDRNNNFQDVVWGYSTIKEYQESSDIFCGPIVGRYGNRINKGRFVLNDSIYQLTINNNDNHLHGGIHGFHTKVWEAKTISVDGDEALKLTYTSKDGEEGYPGNLSISVTYIVTNSNELKIVYNATTDAPTIINPTSHSYFNLTGTSENSILEHVTRINASKFTPTNETLIPTGEFRNVEGTPFDFRKPTPIGARIDGDNAQLKFGQGYDHNFVIDKKPGVYEEIAEIYSPKSGISMSVITDQPGLQFYSGNFMKGELVGKRGDKHHFRSGFAFEAQNFPDAPNHDNFPSAVLLPNETYKQVTSYRFSTVK